MWNKTLTTKIKGRTIQVLVFLYDSDEQDNEVVRQQSMINEYYLIEDIKVCSRDAAYDLISNYPLSMARAFFIRTAYDQGETFL